MRSPKPARAENPLGNTRRSAKAYLYLLPAFAVLAVFVMPEVHGGGIGQKVFPVK